MAALAELGYEEPTRIQMEAITLAAPREYRMLRNIKRVTGRRIPQQARPTVAHLRARRPEATTGTRREDILQGDLDCFRVVVGRRGVSPAGHPWPRVGRAGCSTPTTSPGTAGR
ncbi:MAG: hypothetical protein FJW99_09470, partial [Actinobacteria bacterium]|nr:hypothetical protein [Actinomycetota bacterium]